MPRAARPSPDRRRRAGFTLIELLVVILILGILVALLVPAISGAITTARNAQVSGEITLLSQSLASFNTKYGMYPPSRIMVREDGAPSSWLGSLPAGEANKILANNALAWYNNADPKSYSGPSDITIGLLVQRSATALNKMFPKMGATTPTLFHDFNGNGNLDQGWILLEGHECLAFFLGGVPALTGTSYTMTGFSKSPTFPIAPDSAGGAQNRTQPLFEFKADRLVDDDGDGIPGYLDPRNSGSDARPYAYFSAYGSNGYDPNDCNFVSLGTVPRTNVSADDYWARSTQTNTGAGIVRSFAPNPYTSGDPLPGGLTPPANTRIPPVAFQNKETFQLISAGVDGTFGPGGQYLGDAANNRLPPDVGIVYAGPGAAAGEGRRSEKDNLTNFSQNRLD